MTSIRHVIDEIFNQDFAKCKSSNDLTQIFYEQTLTIQQMKMVHDLVHSSSVTIGGKDIKSAMLVGSESDKPPIAVLAQLHGNEPAGLAGHLLVLALEQAGMLTQQILLVIGNPLASEQYFSAYTEAPRARQELRDAYRCGLGEGGILLPDMNRIPVDFNERRDQSHHTLRAKELYHIGQHISGILDIHSARGHMLCITDHKNDKELKNSPIRSVLVGLSEAIGAHSSNAGTQVKTLKNILAPLANIQYQVGIEAGRHEEEDALLYGSMFTHAFLHTVEASKAAPHTVRKENGVFDCYHVQSKWTYGDLIAKGTFAADDKIYMVKECKSADNIPPQSDRVIVKKEDGSYQMQTIMQFIVQPAGKLVYATFQYDEMEAVAKDQAVAVAVPSGTVLKVPMDATGIFFSKSASLYDKDPAVGPWPFAASKRHDIKFCYPCIMKKEKLKI